ncbi:MAG: patatin [Epsilonproteobacteria bacterium]|nr:patatin [Campylobacterota bacterium]
MKKGKKISLVLGSGGARGYAHIGVIEELTKRGYEIVSISGSSMGALIGGLYACGKLDLYKEWVLDLDALDVASLLDISWDLRGFIGGEKVLNKLSQIVGKQNIEDLPIKFTAVATNLKTNKEVWFQEGDLLKAIRASISIPTFFTPVEMNGMLLVDGGVLNPLPVAPTMSDHTDMTIAVNLYADVPKPKIELSKDEEEKQSKFEQILNDFLQKAQSFMNFSKEDKESYHVFDIMHMSFECIQNTMIRYRLSGYYPDYIIEISRDVCGAYDFYKAYEVIEAGRVAAREALKNMENKNI